MNDFMSACVYTRHGSSFYYRVKAKNVIARLKVLLYGWFGRYILSTLPFLNHQLRTYRRIGGIKRGY